MSVLGLGKILDESATAMRFTTALEDFGLSKDTAGRASDASIDRIATLTNIVLRCYATVAQLISGRSPSQLSPAPIRKFVWCIKEIPLTLDLRICMWFRQDAAQTADRQGFKSKVGEVCERWEQVVQKVSDPRVV